MKRSIIFLCILVTLLIAAVSTEYIYCKSISQKASEMLEKFDGAQSTDDYYAYALLLRKFTQSNKKTNEIFFSKDLTDKLLCETDKLLHIAQGGSISEARVQLENIRFLFKSIYRFNVDS